MESVSKSQAANVSRRFAENLVLLRGRAGLSQQATAERASLHFTEVSLIERSLRLPRLDTILKLAGALEIEACELMAGMAWRLGENVQRPGAFVDQSESS